MGANIIEVKNLTKQYMEQKALDDVSFSVKEGMICGLIGPNGAGKTTIMKALGGLILPTDGEIEIFGAKDEKGIAQSRSRMSFMIETPYAKEGMTAKENLEKQRLQKGIPNKDRVEECLKIVGLENTGNKKVRNFSLGMRQRLGIAIALLSKPEIMIMDEPINGLDPEGIIEIRELLIKLNREEKITIVISSHILSELSLLCTDYIFIHHGKMINTLSAKELSNQCKESYQIHTDNDEKALAILQREIKDLDYDVNEDGSFKVYGQLDHTKEISKTLYEGGVIPVELKINEANLEKFYMDMVGDINAEHNESN